MVQQQKQDDDDGYQRKAQPQSQPALAAPNGADHGSSHYGRARAAVEVGRKLGLEDAAPWADDSLKLQGRLAHGSGPDQCPR